MANLQRRNSPREHFKCSVCSEACTYGHIFCDNCSEWAHTSCEKIAEDKVRLFERLPLDFPYICRKCRCDEDGGLDYGASMLRLQKAAFQGFKKLQACVRREELFLDHGFVGISGVGSLLVDTEAQALLQHYLKKDKGIPAVTDRTDNVLFRAVSLSVSARDCLAVELRMRCCVEMVKHQHFYRYQKNHQELSRCAPDYTDSCIDCAVLSEQSSVWTMSALATVVGRPIMSVYPNVNGTADVYYQVLNTLFEPRERELMSSQLVRILWTSEDGVANPSTWKANHFVPLFDQQKPEPSPSKSQHSHSDMDLSQDMDHDMDAFDDAPELSNDSQTPEPDEPVEMIPLEVAMGGEPMEYDDKFMDVYEAYDKITNATEVLSDIPRGVKENVWFMIDNSYNVSNPGRRNSFYDDCGVWKSECGSVATAYFLVDETGLRGTIKVKGGQFWHLKKDTTKPRRGRKSEWVVMEPQPDPDSVVCCHRYYSFLKRCKNKNDYRRRVIWFTMPPFQQRGRDVAIVEYLGKFPGFVVQKHGNAKQKKANYVRTDPKLLDEVARELETTGMTPMRIFKSMQEKMGSSCSLRDARQIRNLKYALSKRSKKMQRMSDLPQVEMLEQKHTPDVESLKVTVAQDGSSSMTEVTAVHAPPEETQLLSPEFGTYKVIIQGGEEEVEGVVGSVVEGLPEENTVSHARIVEMEDGQQAILMDTGEGGQPGTQTIIMVKDLNTTFQTETGEVVTTHIFQ